MLESKNNDEFLETLVQQKNSTPPPINIKNKIGACIENIGINLTFETIKKTKKESFSIHIDAEVNTALDKFAYKNRVSKSQIIEKILKQVLQI